MAPFLQILKTIGYNSYDLINSEGEWVIEPTKDRNDKQRWSDVNNMVDGLMKVGIASGRHGYVDSTGNFAIEAKFLAASDFSQGMAIVETESGESMLIDRWGSKIRSLYQTHRQLALIVS